MSKESGGAPGGGGNHNGGVNGGGANSGSSSKGSSGSGKGSGKNDSNSKGSSGSSTSKGTSSSAPTSKSAPAGTGKSTASATSKGSPTGSQGVKGQSLASTGQESASSTSSKKGVASRVSSVGSTLSSYGAAPGYARAGYGDTINSQRQQAEASKPGNSNHNISSIGGPSMYGMAQGSYDKSIGTDNFNGVIGNIQQKAQRGTASENDRASFERATRDYNNLRGAGVVGNTVAGTPGKWGAQKLASAVMDAPGDYLSGAARKAATGDLDDSRVIGQRDKIGGGGMADSAVKGGASLLGAMVPGASLLANGISSSMTVGAPGLGELLNSINERLGGTVNSSASNSNGSDKDYAAPPRQSLASTGQSDGSQAFDSRYYDPSRFSVTTGKRGY